MQKHNRNFPWLQIIIYCLMSSAGREIVYAQAALSDGLSFHAITFADATTGIAVGDSGIILKTSNDGVTWTEVETDF